MNTQGKIATKTKKNSASKGNLVVSSDVTVKGKKTQAPVVEKKSTQQTHSAASTKKEHQIASKFYSVKMKVTELTNDGKIRQAYSAIPDETKFPEYALEIKALKADLMEQIWKL